MNLVIDCGNTRCKWALFDGRDLMHQQVEDTGLLALQGCLDVHLVTKILFSNVGHIDNNILEKLRTVAPLSILDYTHRLPFVNKYATPETLGSDRLACAAGAVALHRGHNVLVIDAGTCIKYEMITADGTYLGGAISPGVRMRFKALHEYTEKLPFLEPNADSKLIGDSTYTAIQSGVVNGCRAEADGMINLYKQKYEDLLVLQTGGDSHFFEGTLKNRIFVVPQLTLVGLNEILRCNE